MITRLLFAACLTVCSGAHAAAPDANPYAATITAAERFTVGDTLVEKHGRGPALILIPGLASGSWTWQETIRQFAPNYTVYVLTLPGFDGHPAVPGKSVAAAADSVRQLIETRKLAGPVLIGHSLGATLSLDIASRHPSLVRGVVAIDGLPVFPGTENMPPEQRQMMKTMLGSRRATAEGFAAQQQQYMSMTGTLDMNRATELAKLSGKSDPDAVTRYMSDLMGTDLRAQLPSIKAPVLVLSPYAAVDGAQLGMDEAGKTAYYKSLMQGTPNVTVQSISPSRHYPMFDQPQKTHDAIRSFLASLPK